MSRAVTTDARPSIDSASTISRYRPSSVVPNAYSGPLGAFQDQARTGIEDLLDLVRRDVMGGDVVFRPVRPPDLPHI
jgi:hypothetical protein